MHDSFDLQDQKFKKIPTLKLIEQAFHGEHLVRIAVDFLHGGKGATLHRRKRRARLRKGMRAAKAR